MSGIAAFFSKKPLQLKHTSIDYVFNNLISRGRNSSSLLTLHNNVFHVRKSLSSLNKIWHNFSCQSSIIIGFAGINASQPSEISPIIRQGLILFHDGLVTNIKTNKNEFHVNTPSFSSYILDRISDKDNHDLASEESIEKLLHEVNGTINCLLLDSQNNKLYVFSNHGSLYINENENLIAIASEKELLANLPGNTSQVLGTKIFDLASMLSKTEIKEDILFDYAPSFSKFSSETSILQYKKHNIKRCTRCILPETMPYIKFDVEGVCNYCHAYKLRNQPKTSNRLLELLEPYRRKSGYECIVPFSGGRDSCAALHLIVNNLNLKPITYTYDWGMVTDVGRRNIATMCGKVGVENIVVSDDIVRKRKNIGMNFKAWLRKPDLGMINILTAGDKHFFHYINKIKENTNVDLNLWGVNPLEVTHFKTGFLGIKPDFKKQRVYASGKIGQLRYHSKRLAKMVQSPGYFNSSLWDTYSGEYYRSFSKKKDFFHMFDYWQWNEKEINSLLQEYGWERATDTPTTWRIGDGTAGILNYIYYTIAGFTEHDTFRSNQIREGEITREEALKLVEQENAPCIDNIRWYLKSIGFDFTSTIKKINSIRKIHEGLY